MLIINNTESKSKKHGTVIYFYISKNLKLRRFKSSPNMYTTHGGMINKNSDFRIINKKKIGILNMCAYSIFKDKIISNQEFYLNSKNERGYVRRRLINNRIFYISFKNYQDEMYTICRNGFFGCLKKLENQLK